MTYPSSVGNDVDGGTVNSLKLVDETVIKSLLPAINVVSQRISPSPVSKTKSIGTSPSLFNFTFFYMKKLLIS
uniref:Uncharacterized protein n=1 Tax=Romanomermis culicivorax TaxID=13658 RepID=A0A915IV17_ROMCU